MLLFVYTTTHKRFVIFTCRYFKLSRNTTALSQSNCRNLSGSSIIIIISVIYYQKYVILTCNIHRSRIAPRDCSQLHAKSKSTKPQPLHLPPPPPQKKKKKFFTTIPSEKKTIEGPLRGFPLICQGASEFHFNPLGPKSNQHQFSPNNISLDHQKVKVMRII